MPSTLIVIPARYASGRFPGKPLAPLRGAGGYTAPLVERTWRAACAVGGNPRVVVATDDPRIEDAVQAFGGEAVMTPSACRNGTERCAAVIEQMGDAPDVVINLQGDALLTPPAMLETLASAMDTAPEMAVATPVIRCDTRLWQRLSSDVRQGRVGGTTVARRDDGKALYFSKSLIPHVDLSSVAEGEAPPVWFHVGVYAYRPEALRRYAIWPEGALERQEGLEQLRFLENGVDVHTVECDTGGMDLWELNNPSDVAPIEAALAARGIA